MHRSSYTKELGLDSDRRNVPLPWALAVLAVACGAMWLGARALQAQMEQRASQERLTAAAEAAARPALVKK